MENKKHARDSVNTLCVQMEGNIFQTIQPPRIRGYCKQQTPPTEGGSLQAST